MHAHSAAQMTKAKELIETMFPDHQVRMRRSEIEERFKSLIDGHVEFAGLTNGSITSLFTKAMNDLTGEGFLRRRDRRYGRRGQNKGPKPKFAKRPSVIATAA